jgi:hypothetical protein
MKKESEERDRRSRKTKKLTQERKKDKMQEN